MGGKYTIIARNYDDKVLKMYECTNNIIKAICLYIKARKKYEYVIFEARK